MTGISNQPIAPDATVWRGFTRQELDRAYDNAGTVTDSASHLAAWRERSAAWRATKSSALLDQRYGSNERNRIDIFRCEAPAAPLFVFIHGGYWQRNSKEDFSCMAEGPLAHGFDVALPGYTLGPDASLSEITAEIAAAVSWLRSKGPASGIAENKLLVGGWSAGAHLAALASHWSGVDGVLLISGIYDLQPIQHGMLNDKLRLTDLEVATLSPIRRLDSASSPAVVVYGGAELSELQRQSRDYLEVSQKAGWAPTVLVQPTANHFTILNELASPTGSVTKELLRLVGRPHHSSSS